MSAERQEPGEQNHTAATSSLPSESPPPTQADDGDLAGRGVVRTQVDARHQQQGVVGVELGKLGVAPVELPHAGAVHQRDVAIGALCVPKLKERKKPG